MQKGNGKQIERIILPKSVSKEEKETLLNTLQERFEANINRHKGMNWEDVLRHIQEKNETLRSLFHMEQTGGEPDVIGYYQEPNQYVFADCSAQSPLRRLVCYDQKGEDERTKKGITPAENAITLAKKMGIELMNEGEYRYLQTLGEFDTKTSSWIKTPENIRKLGGALCMERRYDTVFLFHNSAKLFYSDRGFRGILRF